MAAFFDTFGVIAQIALRNLFASKWKTLIVGGIIGFGAFLVVLGTSLLESVNNSMSRSIIGSVAGNIQVYSSESKDNLDVMGGFEVDPNQIEPLPDFARVERTIMSVPNVAQVVPMGINSALVMSGNTVDQALARLRSTVNKRKDAPSNPTLTEAYTSETNYVRQMVEVLSIDLANRQKILDEGATGSDDQSTIQRAASPQFWADFDRDPYANLEFLENRLAPLAADADMLFLRYMGTDPKAFAKAFDRMTIVDGQSIPEGKRGFLFSKYMYEEQVKLKTARAFDKIYKALTLRGLTIAKDVDLSRMARECPNQAKELTLQLDAVKTRLFRDKLQSFLKSKENNVRTLLEQFLRLDDGNFRERHAFFYGELAPSLELYRVRIGDTLTIKAFTRSGYVQSANLRVYGTFAFKGLEQSPQAGSINLMDLVSFRELYGFMTDDREKEIAAMRSKSGAKDVSRENAESELFGTAQAPNAEMPQPFNPTSRPADKVGEAPPEYTLLEHRKAEESLMDAPYAVSQLRSGVFINAAVILKDDKKLEETRLLIEAAGKREGLPLKAVSWQNAVGLIGQFAVLMRVVLYVAVLIIFVVALVIINNALVMATLERVRELGTLRAIGAQRRFILSMLVLESIVVGLVFGALGTALGSLLVLFLGQRGIPAANDIFMFFFSGPRLYPTLSSHNLGIALAIVLVVSMISSFYPAWIAMRVSPREAMQSEE